MTKTEQVEKLTGGYTARELRQKVFEYSKRKVTPYTIGIWRSRLGIKPDANFLYNESDLEWLVKLANWLNRGKNCTIKAFIELHKDKTSEESETNAK